MALAPVGWWWGARITAWYLFGGFLLGMGAGVLLGAPFIPMPQPVKVALAGGAAIVTMVFASVRWARSISQKLGVEDDRRVTWAGALSFGPAVILTGAVLTLLEPRAVAARAFPIHVVYGLLFVPAAFAVATLTIWVLCVGLRIRKPEGLRRAVPAGGAAALAFLVVYLAMDAAGWRVGGPDAGRRATMLVVTALGSLAAGTAGGAVLGAGLIGKYDLSPTRQKPANTNQTR